MIHTFVAMIILVCMCLWYTGKVGRGAPQIPPQAPPHAARPGRLFSPITYLLMVVLGLVLAALWMWEGM
jgi:hypothetical protein